MARLAGEGRADETGAPPLLRLSGVTKHFGPLAAVDDVSLEIVSGECFCLLGPSGCGKSTLLRLIGGFEEASGGSIMFEGRDLAGVPPHRRALNTMFQSYALFPHMSVGANIAYGLKRDGLPRREIAERVDEMLRLVRLDGLAGRMPDRISGGQRQRVALARALARRPRLLLLDEPLGALDRRLREETQIELKALQARLGTTFIVVTHDQEEAMILADRIGVMERGRLVQVGPPREIYARPRTRFVAGFVGDVNLFDGEVLASRDGHCDIHIDAITAPFRIACDRTLAVGARVTVAIRPEALEPVDADDPGGRNRFEGHLEAVTYRGGFADWRVALPDGRRVRVTRIDSRGTAQEPVDPDAAVRLRFAAAAGTVLDT